MNLDDLLLFNQLDTQKIYDQILSLPDQLRLGWEDGNARELPDWTDVTRVVIAGMGSAIIPGDILASGLADRCTVPVFLHRDYGLPAWASGKQTLVIAISYSGNTEETLAAYKQAAECGCQRLAICTGGELARASGEMDTTVWLFNFPSPGGNAVGYLYSLLVTCFSRTGWLPDLDGEMDNAISAVKRLQDTIGKESPATRNPAKRMAGQLMERAICVVGSGGLEPVARYWKVQFNELAKVWAVYDALPEMDHNSISGTMFPDEALSKLFTIFLRSSSDAPQNRLRSDLTRQALMLNGFSTDFVDAQGDGPIAQLWTCLHFGDFTAYYLAMAYRIDPMTLPIIDEIKREMETSMG